MPKSDETMRARIRALAEEPGPFHEYVMACDRYLAQKRANEEELKTARDKWLGEASPTASLPHVMALVDGAQLDADESPDRARRGEWMQTFTGKRFWPLDPRPEDFDLEAIAHALSNLCRFGGHTRTLYTVGEHSVRVSYVTEVLLDEVRAPKHGAVYLDEETTEAALILLGALFHDATEAYLLDMPRPLKVHLPDYRTIYDGVDRALAGAFGLDVASFHSPLVKRADDILLATEARDLMKMSVNNPPFAGALAGEIEERKKAWMLTEPLAERLNPWPQAIVKDRFLARARGLAMRLHEAHPVRQKLLPSTTMPAQAVT
jgi:uncharacterized protein